MDNNKPISEDITNPKHNQSVILKLISRKYKQKDQYLNLCTYTWYTLYSLTGSLMAKCAYASRLDTSQIT